MRPLKEFGPPVLDLCEPKPFLDHQSMFDLLPARPLVLHAGLRRRGAQRRGDRHRGRSLAAISSPLTAFPIWQLGGRSPAWLMRRRPSTAAARHTFNITAGTAQREGFDEEREWVAGLLVGSSPTTRASTSTSSWTRARSGSARPRREKYDRLKALKRRYDPTTSSGSTRTSRRIRDRFGYAGLVVLKRVIPCLDVDNGRVVKGTNFVDIRDAGDPVELAERYDAEGADELVFLDITASHEGRDPIVELARRTADNVFDPLHDRRRHRSLEDAQAVLDAGSDKVSVNSAALARPELIEELADPSAPSAS